MVMKDVSAKQAYEWAKIHHWSLHSFLEWLKAKNIQHEKPLFMPGGTLIHRPLGPLVFEWIKTDHWTFKRFQYWLNSFL